jgi:EmrB/QacA subfamily drug resistance transporter
MVRKAFEPAPLAALARQSYHSQLVVGVACIGAFMGQFDASIVQLALPVLQGAFKTSVDQVRWVAIAYPLALATCLPIFSRLCEMFGRKLLYLIGFAAFGTASLLCSLAQDLQWLVVFRILQGIGASLLGANSIAIIVKSVPQPDRGRALGWFTTAQAVGVSTGPVLGGVLLEHLGWPSVFWVGVPVSFAGAVLGWLVLPRTTDLVDDAFDWAGALLLMPSLLLAIFALNQTSVWPLLSPQMVLCAAAAAIFLGLFVWRERKAGSPLIDLTAFRENAFDAGILGVTLSYALLYGMFFLISYALMHGYQESAQTSGVKLAAIPVAIGVVAPFAATFVERWSFRVVGVAGMALCVMALLLVSATSIWWQAERHVLGTIGLILFGSGLGLFMGPNSNATIEAAPPAHAATASGLVNLMRGLGNCIGVSAASSVLAWRLAQHAGGEDRLDRLYHSRILLEAVDVGLFMLMLFAMAAAFASLVRPQKASEKDSTPLGRHDVSGA